ncbi:MAG: hypothetical protein ACE5HO_09655 [bacterium]
MKLLSTKSLYFFAFLFTTKLLFAGAWTQKKGHYYAKLSVQRFASRSQYLLNGDKERLADNGEIIDSGVFFYLEYGLFNNFTIVGSLPFRRLNFSCATSNCDNTTTGVGDFYGAFRYQLSQKPWVVSVQSGIKVASGYETDEEKLNSAPPLGDGQTDVDFHLLLGRSILDYRGYVNVDVGYRARSGEPVDEIPYAFEAGFDLAKNYVLIGQLYGVIGISENGQQQDFRVANGQVQNFVGTGAVEEFLKGQLQLVYHLNPVLDLSFVFEQVLNGKNTSQATILGGGISIHR